MYILKLTVACLLVLARKGHGANIKKDDEQLFNITITMPGFNTTQEDQYAFVQYELPDEELTIVAYTPLIDMNAAHHMLTYACSSPSSRDKAWSSGGGGCGAGEQVIIHGWARNAPPLVLPEDVGFPVGRNTPYKYIVLNIHYLRVLQNDHSGNQLLMSRKPRKFQAGVLLGGTSQIYLKPKSHTVRSHFSCRYDGPPISIFAARVHAHKWARVNSLYRVRDGQITQVAKGDPQWPQSFYPLASPVDIQRNDYLVGQCVFDNDDDRTVRVGATHNDEMCNIYAMYSFEPEKTVNGKQKTGKAPISSCWDNEFGQLTALIPSDSEVPPRKPAEMGEMEHPHHHSEHAMSAPVSQPGNLYECVESWPDVKTLPSYLGQIGGVALSNGNDELIVFHRGSRKWETKYFDDVHFRNTQYGPIDEPVVHHIDTRTGQVKSEWGAKMFYMPHGMTIDDKGNFWVTDVAMHQVFMFMPSDLTHPALTVGEMFTPGSGPTQLCRPADVAVMRNGDFFVADGYCNSRIVKFNRKGEYINEWGSPTRNEYRDADGYPVPNEWNIVHSLALNEDAQLLCGADRENYRIQCFNLNGEFQRQIRVEEKKNIGPIYAIEFTPNANSTILYAVSGGHAPTKKVYMINAKDGEILTSFDSNPHLGAPHDIAVSTNGREVFVGELAGSPANALHKFQMSQKRDLPSQTFSRRTYLSDKNFRVSLIIMAFFALPVLIAVIVGCIVRARNMRKMQRLNMFLSDVKNTGTGSSSVLGDWMNRRKGFQRLNQYSDGENEPLDRVDESNSGDEIVGLPASETTNKTATAAPSTTQNITFKMGASL